MWDNATEIQKVLEKHQFTINAIIFDVMGTFKLSSIVKFAKIDGYGVPEILALLIMLPLLLLNRVNSLYHSDFQRMTTMKKDALYCLKNQERMPWRPILYGVAKRFQALTRSEPGAADTSTFILDDTADARVGRRIENVSGPTMLYTPSNFVAVVTSPH